MADRGAIGYTQPLRAALGFVNPTWWVAPMTVRQGLALARPAVLVATWAVDSRRAIEIPRTGALSGVVTVDGAPVPHCTVRLYYRPNGLLIDAVRAGADGAFTFTGLEAGQSLYYVVAFDPDGGTVYNARILDRVAPV